MKKFITLTLVIFLSACSGQNNFKYNKDTACVVDYGFNGISVITDGERTLIRNNRMSTYNSIVRLKTVDKIYTTRGRYFPENLADGMIESISKSEKIYIEWIELEGNNGGKRSHRTTIDTTEFGCHVDNCPTQKNSR